MQRHIVVPILIAIAFATGRAQTSETPVPFDSAGRIASVSETLAGRLGLAAPAWPVTGSFSEARLYRTGEANYVIVVRRSTGANDRYQLTAEQMVALRAAFAAGTERVGRVVAEDASSLVAEEARGPFVRDQMLLSALMYGPALSSLTDDASFGTGVYLLSVGGTFFGLTNMAKTRTITKAQHNMSTDGAFRGYGFLAGTLDALGVNLEGKVPALTVLAGGVGGSMMGYQRGKGLTNSEAQAAMTGSTLTAGAVFGAAWTTGLITDSDNSGRASSAALVAGGVTGYLVGPTYPRRAGYTVTAGDISLVKLGAILGTMAAITPITGMDSPSPHLVAGLATAGWVGGALIGDRIAAKPFNHSSNDYHMIYLGAFGGALMGAAVPVIAQSDNGPFIMSFVTGGAIAGAIAAQRMMDPPREGSFESSHGSASGQAWQVSFNPQGALMTLTKQRGNHSLLHITF